MNKVDRVLNIILGLIVVGLIVAGGTGNGGTSKGVEVVQDSKYIVASQVAYDGECQVTYSDGTSETVWLDLPETGVYYEAPVVAVQGSTVLPNGRNLYSLTNGLEVLVSEAENIYELYLPFMGDHSLEYKNLDMLTNGVLQYSEGFGSYVNEVVNTVLEEYDREQ